MNKTRRRSTRARWAQITALVALIVMLQWLTQLAAAAERLRVAHSTLTATNSVLWVARDRGIFPRHGLDVSLIYVAGVRSMQALLAQEVEIGSVSGTTAIQANLSGADSVIIGGISNSVLMSLVATPDITAVEALRGKRVGVTRFGSLSDFMARSYLTRAGVTPDRDVAILQTGGYPESVAALQAGGIQAAMLSPPFHTIAIKRLGFRELIDLSRTTKYQSNALVTLRRFAQSKPTVLTAFMEAYTEAVRVFKQDRSSRLECWAALCGAMTGRSWKRRTASTATTSQIYLSRRSRGYNSFSTSWRRVLRKRGKRGPRISSTCDSCRRSMRRVARKVHELMSSTPDN
jgi:NitT/TauT family transport system substrate-binding protein